MNNDKIDKIMIFLAGMAIGAIIIMLFVCYGMVPISQKPTELEQTESITDSKSEPTEFKYFLGTKEITKKKDVGDFLESYGYKLSSDFSRKIYSGEEVTVNICKIKDETVEFDLKVKNSTESKCSIEKCSISALYFYENIGFSISKNNSHIYINSDIDDVISTLGNPLSFDTYGVESHLNYRRFYLVSTNNKLVRIRLYLE